MTFFVPVISGGQPQPQRQGRGSRFGSRLSPDKPCCTRPANSLETRSDWHTLGRITERNVNQLENLWSKGS